MGFTRKDAAEFARRRAIKREAAREPGFDQDSFGAVLRPGTNALLVKVAQAEGP